MKYVILSGVPSLGFEITGDPPFDSLEEANKWGEKEFEGEPYWWVMPLMPNIYEACSACGTSEPCDCEVELAETLGEALVDVPLVGKEMERVIHRQPKLHVVNGHLLLEEEKIDKTTMSQMKIAGT